jgi:hypothetical protein
MPRIHLTFQKVIQDSQEFGSTEEHMGVLWIGTELGGFDLWDNQDDHFKIYRHEPGNPSSLTQDRLPGGQFMPC